ncbi:hypothetical protein [Methylobacterium sp. NEAU K]|uniref:hypothetical protein n=1 Tax=Methylobacterium sp. NEAU K TaxID=3064946 RepID=UPI0027375331|nr:hypothetical protein [Methylobacterium sp. NEAU K]MDP4006491.1 hypothetical protein [Methylobacterium sp. NEAU K]
MIGFDSKPSATFDCLAMDGAPPRIEAAFSMPEPRYPRHPRATDQDEGDQPHGFSPWLNLGILRLIGGTASRLTGSLGLVA